jgi:hypothetical protein
MRLAQNDNRNKVSLSRTFPLSLTCCYSVLYECHVIAFSNVKCGKSALQAADSAALAVVHLRLRNARFATLDVADIPQLFFEIEALGGRLPAAETLRLPKGPLSLCRVLYSRFPRKSAADEAFCP